jgi:hypothetical protein
MSLPKLNTPIFELILPSTGETVRFRPFLVKEHKILLTMAEADTPEIGKIVRELVSVCTFEKIDANKLPHFDIEYIFLNLRSKSIGESVDVIVNCPCGNKIDTSFNIEDLKVIRKENHTPKIMLTDKFGVEMAYPKFQEVMEVFQSNNTGRVVELIINNIKGVFDDTNYWDTKEQTKQEIEEFVDSLTKEQFDKIEEFFVTAPKIVQEIETDCPKCNRHNSSKLEGLSNFFV